MDLKKKLCQVADVTRGRISRAQTFSDFLAYSALLESSRIDAEWQAFHQTLCSEV